MDGLYRVSHYLWLLPGLPIIGEKTEGGDRALCLPRIGREFAVSVSPRYETMVSPAPMSAQSDAGLHREMSPMRSSTTVGLATRHHIGCESTIYLLDTNAGLFRTTGFMKFENT